MLTTILILTTMWVIRWALAVFDVALDVARYARLDRADESVTVLVVGDGHSPRTGALVVLHTRWQVTVVDPVLTVQGQHPKIPRLTCMRARIEDLPELAHALGVTPTDLAPDMLLAGTSDEQLLAQNVALRRELNQVKAALSARDAEVMLLRSRITHFANILHRQAGDMLSLVGRPEGELAADLAGDGNKSCG
mgnify:CR=1 FL=1